MSPSLLLVLASAALALVGAVPVMAQETAENAPVEGCHTPGGTERHDVLEAMSGVVARDLRQAIEFKVSKGHC